MTKSSPSPSESNIDDQRAAIRSPRLHTFHTAITRGIERLRPYTWLWPPIAFSLGLASFFLVDRQQALGGILALCMLLAWVLLLSESVIGRLLVRLGYPSLPRGVTAFIAQMIHQETLFFSLPFLLATTVWSSGQAIFTLLILGMAALSILDPLYFKLAERYRWIYFAFHAQCVFVVVLVTLPTLVHLTTGESLLFALIAMVIFALPSLIHLLRPKRVVGWLAMFGLAMVLALVAWTGRAWVPPANLWLTGSALSPGFDTEARQPQGKIPLNTAELQSSGLYAYTAIRAPRGLREKIYHEWHHEGELIDRIPLIIHGGREQGYRAWTHKKNIPDDPAGQWRIDVMTTSGQRIGVIRFTVDEGSDNPDMADGKIMSPAGLPGLDWRRLLPGD